MPALATRPAAVRRPLSEPDEGAGLYDLVARLYPLHRGITGDGLRDTLRLLGEYVPLTIHEVPSGTQVLDWTVPDEWHIREAFVADRRGRRLVDLDRDGPLAVVQGSHALRTRMRLSELRPHLHTLPDRPDWTPYRTAHFARTWGFCLPHRTLASLTEADGPFDVVLDADHFPGAMSLGECVLPGQSDETVLISAHACHPAMANDNASSLAVAVHLARWLSRRPRRYTYRFLFGPGTLGAIAWLARNADVLPTVRHGLVLANLGDGGRFVYKQTRRGTLGDKPLAVDRAVAHALSGKNVEVRPFTPDGYDERQFGSPGFDLPVGRLTRTPDGEFAEYHTSADDLHLVTPDALAGSLAALRRIVDVLEGDEAYRNTQPFGEPQLGRRGLYAPIGGHALAPEAQRAVGWVLNLSDGDHSLLDVAERSGLPFPAVRAAADRLLAAGLLDLTA